MQTSTIAWVVIIILIVVGGGWYFLANNNGSAVTPSTQMQTNQNPNGSDVTPGATANNTVTVLYGPNGFSPSTVTVKQGDTVTFTNNGGDAMWIASAPHPTHQGYDGTTKDTHCATGYTGAAPLDQCAAGTTYSFKFDKVGIWKYHNHNDTSNFGTVVVQ
ncbi:MAG: hypothetical protein Q7R71_00285 [bacterium]|nr:hypothetical protein [bacterium]